VLKHRPNSGPTDPVTGRTCSRQYEPVDGVVLVGPSGVAEAVKANETSFDQTFCISASWGSLIHATVGSTGGVGRPANLDGLAA
jgi:hypothetical protein